MFHKVAVHQHSFRAMGAAQPSIPETYAGVQQGVVDGLEGSHPDDVFNLKSTKWLSMSDWQLPLALWVPLHFTNALGQIYARATTDHQRKS
ncbi:hypothetical protein OH492_07925 [Vibrio chagasii]|nr:hypothetical protein [Vibrio chagasii]